MSPTVQRRRLLGIVIAVALASIISIAATVTLVNRQADSTDRANSAVAALQQACDQVARLGGRCATQPADLVKGDTGDSGPAGPAGPTPSNEDIYRAVQDYFTNHPPAAGRAPTAAEIAIAVINYLTANPVVGERGPGPTADQVASAVKEYLTANPPAAGPKGDDGPGPTADQVAAAVQAYMTAHPLPQCAPGYEAQAHQVVTTDAGSVDSVVCVKLPDPSPSPALKR